MKGTGQAGPAAARKKKKKKSDGGMAEKNDGKENDS